MTPENPGILAKLYMRCEGPKPTHGSQIKRRVGAARAGSIIRVGVVSHSSSEKSLNTLHAAGRKAAPSCTVRKTHFWNDSGYMTWSSRGSRWSGLVDREKGVREAGSRRTLSECALSLQRGDEVLQKQSQKQTAGGRQLGQLMFFLRLGIVLFTPHKILSTTVLQRRVWGFPQPFVMSRMTPLAGRWLFLQGLFSGVANRRVGAALGNYGSGAKHDILKHLNAAGWPWKMKTRNKISVLHPVFQSFQNHFNKTRNTVGFWIALTLLNLGFCHFSGY